MSLRFTQLFDQQASKALAEVNTLAEIAFGQHDARDCAWRFENMPALSLFLAWQDDTLIGFKAGYAVTSTRYYSWLGGVHPAYRQQGIAHQLMLAQHAWLAEQGFKRVETETSQTNHAMCQLNEQCGFVMIGTRFDENRPRIIFRKSL